jgi:general secretion pathway protein M
LQSAVTQAQSRLATKRADLAWMQSHAAEIIAAGDIGAAPAGESPIVLVDRTGREAGLASALRGTQPNGAAGVRVQLEGAPFDTLVRWLAVLEQRHGLAIESITVDRSAGSGLVNASVNFAQPKP